MKLRTLLSVLVATLFFLPTLAYSGEPNRPQIQVEVVPSGVRGLKVDLFVLITNPNDFDVYVGTIESSNITSDYQMTFGDGPAVVGSNDFFLVPAKSKRIQQLQLGYELKDGLNHIKVRLSGGIDPNAKLPTNYIPFGGHQFELTIGTQGSK